MTITTLYSLSQCKYVSLLPVSKILFETQRIPPVIIHAPPAGRTIDDLLFVHLTYIDKFSRFICNVGKDSDLKSVILITRCWNWELLKNCMLTCYTIQVKYSFIRI